MTKNRKKLRLVAKFRNLKIQINLLKFERISYLGFDRPKPYNFFFPSRSCYKESGVFMNEENRVSR